MNVAAATVDDIVRRAFESILETGRPVSSRRAKGGNILEVVGAQLSLTNPLARVCVAENRATLFSCLGEFLWYLSKGNSIDFIRYYAPQYPKHVQVVNGAVPGGYGPRLFDWDGVDQVANVIGQLRKHPTSKQAAIQLLDRNDLASGMADVPCTCTLQFLCRDGRLDLIATMRSNDAVRGLPHDIFAFTMIQELIARSIGVDLGTYRHWVGSLHIYEEDKELAQNLVAEGWQQTIGVAMPAMPRDPWSFIPTVLDAEQSYRVGGLATEWTSTGQEYWDEIIWLLEMRRHLTSKDVKAAEGGLARKPRTAYSHFLRDRLARLKRKVVE